MFFVVVVVLREELDTMPMIIEPSDKHNPCFCYYCVFGVFITKHF